MKTLQQTPQGFLFDNKINQIKIFKVKNLWNGVTEIQNDKCESCN